jgi:FtsZ-binding cell division protein ZapB
MNKEALKLADELLRDNTQLTVESAYMIRRLVEELKAKNNYLAQHCAMIDEQQKEIRNLEDAVKNALIYINNHKKAKPLSDEEIIEMVKEHFVGAIKLGIVLSHDNVLGFARAIEERHGIK